MHKLIKPSTFFNNSILILCLLGVSATTQAQPPEIAEAGNIPNCRFLDQVDGSSGYGKHTDWNVLAKHAVLRRAEKLGASHIVLKQFYPVGGFNGVITANAYQCGS